MATSQSQVVFQCSVCHEELNLESKTLPCLHSLCRSCLDKHFMGETNGNDQCPECHESLRLDQLSLSPHLVRTLKCRQLETADWKCDLCLEGGIESIATNYCRDCQELFCANCCRCHKKLQREFLRQHDIRDLHGIERAEVIKAKMTDVCPLHKKERNLYCEPCNVCLCDACYKNHSADSSGCLSRPLAVREEALKKKSQGPTLAKEMAGLERDLRRLNERTRNCRKELNSDCLSKCQQLWMDFEEMMENAKQKTDELCEDIRRITAEQVKQWSQLLEENKRILKQLEIWRLNLHHLISESQEDVDVVCGLQSLGSKLSQLQKSVGLGEKYQLRVTFPNWWLQVLEQLKSEKIGSASLTIEKLPSQNLVLEKQWNLCGSKLWINSIQVSEDDHIFVCDCTSIIEFTDSGKFVSQCVLVDGENEFYPTYMCLISPDVFVVCCTAIFENKLIFLERRKIPPYLQIKQIVDTEKGFCSLCQMNKTIFTCDWGFQIESFSKEGEKLKTIKTGESWCMNWPLIRADPPTGNFWGTRENEFEIFCFNPNGEKLRSMEIEEAITDFCVNKLSHIYFCNQDGIFSYSPRKVLLKFEKRSDGKPKIFFLKNRLFVALTIDGKNVIQIYKILD